MSFIFISLALIAGLATALIWRRGAAPIELATGSYLSPRRSLPEFSLMDQNGRPFGPANLRGHWSILFFGYTHCPDFCPTTLSTLAGLEKRLQDERAAVRPQVIFVSVDAKRDTPAQLATYVPAFDPAFIGVTAPTQPDIDALAAKLGVAVVITPAAGGSYTVDHTGALFVLDPRARLTAILTGPLTVDSLQRDFERIVAGRP
ncbi:MAG: SCO family protein [Pseudomonadota bacterium]|nr:SCO family protein [Pseudomonadota bacterium]